jgi:hypothetical protein
VGRKFTILFLALTTVLSVGAVSPSKKKKAASIAGTARATKPKDDMSDYSTSHSFDGAAIKGRVQEGNLHRIVVENDKSLDDLLGVRKNFDDRTKKEAQRNQTW